MLAAGPDAPLRAERARLAALIVFMAAAILGQLVTFSAWGRANPAVRAGLLQVPPSDFDQVWVAGRALVTGHSAFPFYGGDFQLGYAPPYTVLFSPFALLTQDVAAGLTRVLAAVLVVAALLQWGRRSGRTGLGYALIASAPAVQLVLIDQVQTALGFAALSAACWGSLSRRWWLLGTGAALALIRPTNAIPVIVVLAVGCRRSPWGLVRAAGWGLLLALPLLAIAFLWDRTWITDYSHNLAIYRLLGPPRLALALAGTAGPLGLVVVVSVVGGLLALRHPGYVPDLDTAAFVMALSILGTSLAGFYTGIFILPAAALLARRPGFEVAAWLIAGLPWIAALLLSPLLLGTGGQRVGELMQFLMFGMALATYPLIRSRAIPDAPSPNR